MGIEEELPAKGLGISSFHTPATQNPCFTQLFPRVIFEMQKNGISAEGVGTVICLCAYSGGKNRLLKQWFKRVVIWCRDLKNSGNETMALGPPYNPNQNKPPLNTTRPLRSGTSAGHKCACEILKSPHFIIFFAPYRKVWVNHSGKKANQRPPRRANTS